MAKYMLTFSYSKEGVQGLLKDGGSKRRAAVDELVKSLGGKLEAMYYTFGDDDGFVIVDGVDNVAATAASLITSATGAVSVRTTVLLTPEEIDQAAQKTGKYVPPGQ